MPVDFSPLQQALVLGPLALSKPLRERFALEIAVDGGLKHFRKRRRWPHLAIGDWDSMPGGVPVLYPHSVEIHIHPASKDRSDLGLALDALLERETGRRISSVLLDGFIGGRKDHELGVYFEVVEFLKRSRCDEVRLSGLKGDRVIFFRTGGRSIRLDATRSGVFSIFAWGMETRGLSVRGARFPLSEGRLRPGTHGLSNAFQGNTAVISGKSGIIAIVLPAGR